jgi:hypothetical protein
MTKVISFCNGEWERGGGEVGRWGDGEMGKCGECGEMGRWGDGEKVKGKREKE